MTIYTIGVFAIFLVYVLIGNFAGRSVKDSADYFVSGRSAPTVLIVGTLVASYASTVAFMGETGFSYDGYPMLMLLLIPINVSGYAIGATFFGRYLRRSKCFTIPEYFGKRFNSKRVQIITGVTLVLGIGSYLVAVTQGASILMSELLGVGYGWSLLIVWAVYTSFTLYSGSKGVLLTNTIMFFLFMVMTAMAGPYLMKAAGGSWTEAITALAHFSGKPDILAWHGLTGDGSMFASPMDALVWCLVLGLVWMMVVAVSPWQATQYLMARSEQVAIRSGLIVPVCVLLLYICLHIPAAAINLLNPTVVPSEKAFMWAAFNVLPKWMGVLMLGGIISAAISSCSTFLSVVGLSFTRDILGKTEENPSLLKISRLVMASTGMITLAVTYFQPPAVMWIGYFAATLFAASWGPTAFMSVWSKRISAKGAFWGIMGGVTGVIAGEVIKRYAGVDLPVFFRPPVIGFTLSLVSIFLFSTPDDITPQEREFRIMLHETPEEEKNPKEYRKTILICKGMLGAGVLLGSALFVFWGLPYMRTIQ